MSFTSAQTSNESIQNSTTNGEISINKTQRVYLDLLSRDVNAMHQVFHMWKPVNKKWGLYFAHHSHILVLDMTRRAILNFGLFYSRTTKKAYIAIRKGQPSIQEGWESYKKSGSYSPNPLEVSGVDIQDAFDYAAYKCSSDYQKYYNNCQKFARIFMEQLGSRHNRNPFHP